MTRTRVAALALLSGAATLLHSASAVASNPWGADYFPNVSLTTHEGKVVHFYDDLLKGKAVAINLIYTHCSASCPLETAKLAQVQRLLGDRVGSDIFFYSISIDPKHDTPEVLKAYAQKFHVGPGWLFLTGKEEDIKLLARKLGLSSLTDAANRDGHMPSLMVGNESTGQWMRNSAVDDPRFLATTIGNFLGWKTHEPARSYADLRELPKVDRGAYLFKTRCAACRAGQDARRGRSRRRGTFREVQERAHAEPAPVPRGGGRPPLLHREAESCRTHLFRNGTRLRRAQRGWSSFW